MPGMEIREEDNLSDFVGGQGRTSTEAASVFLPFK